MKSLACLIILPEFKDDNHIQRWDENLEWANAMYDKYPIQIDENIDYEKRWAVGYVAWKKMLKFNTNPNIKVFFVRTDYRIRYKEYKVDDDIISVGFNNSHGHIIYKTIIGFKILKDYDFVVRGNVNSIVDIYELYNFLEPIRTDNVFTSPFWEGGSYPFGYFMLLSKDIVNYLSEIDVESDKRFLTEDTADDYELTNIILKKYIHIILYNCDSPQKSITDPLPIISKVNKYGIRFLDTEPSNDIITQIKNSEDSIFLYRIKAISDKNYISVYKSLIKHIWNKIVKKRYSDMRIFNELGYLVPHLEYERDEQLLVSQYIKDTDTVLELGARYGSVSCIINKILKNKRNQVSVEPDNTVWKALERNKKENKCEFEIYKGIISSNKYDLKLNGYGSTVDISNTINNMETITTQNISLQELQSNTGLKFNVLVADCEGFLETFLKENSELYEQLDTILFECDRPDVCNYDNIKAALVEHNFKLIENGFQCVFKKLNM